MNQPPSLATNIKPHWLLVATLLLVLLGKIVVTIAIVDRGFDLTDEGCIMLWMAYPDLDPHPFYYFHKILQGFFPFVEWNIVNMRLLKVFSDVTVLVLLAAVVYRNVDATWQHGKTFLLAVGVIGLGYFSQFFAPTFYEGDMSFLFATIAIGLPLLFLRVEDRRFFYVSLLVSGVFIGLQVFNKFSTSIICFVVALFLSVYISRKGWGLLVNLFGVALGVACFFLVTGYQPAVWKQEYNDGFKYLIEPMGYKPMFMLLFYAVSGLILLTLASMPIGVFALLRFALGKWGYWQSPHLVFIGLLISIYGLCFWFLGLTYSESHYHMHPLMVDYWYAPLISVVLYWFFFGGFINGFGKAEVVVLAYLLMLPFASFMGSATPLNISVAAYLMPWFAMLALLLIKYFSKQVIATIGAMVVLTVGSFIYLHWVYPFRLAAPMSAQAVPLQTPNGQILVDTALANLVHSTQKVLVNGGITELYPMVSLHNQPGLVYLANGYSPATPWYFEFKWLSNPEVDSIYTNFTCMHIGRIRLFEKRLPVFFINQYVLAEVNPCLEKYGYYLANDYLPPVVILNPSLRQENEGLYRELSDSLLIYIPKGLQLR